MVFYKGRIESVTKTLGFQTYSIIFVGFISTTTVLQSHDKGYRQPRSRHLKYLHKPTPPNVSFDTCLYKIFTI